MRFLLSCLCLAALSATAHAEALFPLGKSMTRGKPLPPPYGVTATYYIQEQDYELENLSFNLPGFALPGSLSSENKSQSWLAQPRVWLLPFLQIFGVIGQVENETRIGNIPLPGAESLLVKSDGTVRGGGFFLGGGGDKWFAGVSASLTQTDLDVADGRIRTLNLAPRIGRPFSWGALWIGANFLDSTEKSSGVFQFPPGFPLPVSSVAYSAEFGPSSRWNAALGVRYDLYRHLVLSAEAGFIQRTSLRLAAEIVW